MRQALESLDNGQHVAAVNELSWWRLMLRERILGRPISVKNKPCPDFEAETPYRFYVEVTTLNVSQADRESGEAALEHSESFRRTVLKVTKEKNKQIAFAASQNQAILVAIFDYSTWSGFGTYRHLSFWREFFRNTSGFSLLSADVSAVALIERQVTAGKVRLSRDRSAIYHNPLAARPLPFGAFISLKQVQLGGDNIVNPDDPAWLEL